MAVYIDKLRNWGWRLGPSCHLIADTNEELHAFAAEIGLKRQWFQAKASGPHYDLTAWRRAAVAAVEAAPDEASKSLVRSHLFR